MDAIKSIWDDGNYGAGRLSPQDVGRATALLESLSTYGLQNSGVGDEGTAWAAGTASAYLQQGWRGERSGTQVFIFAPGVRAPMYVWYGGSDLFKGSSLNERVTSDDELQLVSVIASAACGGGLFHVSPRHWAQLLDAFDAQF